MSLSLSDFCWTVSNPNPGPQRHGRQSGGAYVVQGAIFDRLPRARGHLWNRGPSPRDARGLRFRVQGPADYDRMPWRATKPVCLRGQGLSLSASAHGQGHGVERERQACLREPARTGYRVGHFLVQEGPELEETRHRRRAAQPHALIPRLGRADPGEYETSVQKKIHACG